MPNFNSNMFNFTGEGKNARYDEDEKHDLQDVGQEEDVEETYEEQNFDDEEGYTEQGYGYEEEDDEEEDVDGYVEFDYNGRKEKLSDKDIVELLSTRDKYREEQSSPVRQAEQLAAQLVTKDDFLRSYISLLNAGNTPDDARKKAFDIYGDKNIQPNVQQVQPDTPKPTKREIRKSEETEMLASIERGEKTNYDYQQMKDRWKDEDFDERFNKMKEELMKEINPVKEETQQFTQSIRAREVNNYNDSVLVNSLSRYNIDVSSLSKADQESLSGIVKEAANSIYSGTDFNSTKLSNIQSDVIIRTALDYWKPSEVENQPKAKKATKADRIASEANRRKGMPISVDRASRKPKNSQKKRQPTKSDRMKKASSDLFKLARR